MNTPRQIGQPTVCQNTTDLAAQASDCWTCDDCGTTVTGDEAHVLHNCPESRRTALESTIWSAWSDTGRAADAASCQMARHAGTPEGVAMMNALDQLRAAEAALAAALGHLGVK